MTNQRAIGSASAVEVQLTPSVKVAARVLVADRVRDVAVLWIDPADHRVDPAGSARLRGRAEAAVRGPAEARHDRRAARGPKEVSPGEMVRVEPHASVADFRLAPGSTGGPVFGTGGGVVGLSSVVDDQDERRQQGRPHRSRR